MLDSQIRAGRGGGGCWLVKMVVGRKGENCPPDSGLYKPAPDGPVGRHVPSNYCPPDKEFFDVCPTHCFPDQLNDILLLSGFPLCSSPSMALKQSKVVQTLLSTCPVAH